MGERSGMNEKTRLLLMVLGAVLAVLGLLALFLRARRRWREGKQAYAELKTQSRAMHLEQQGMAESMEATRRPKK